MKLSDFRGQKTAQMLTTTLAAGATLTVPGIGVRFYLVEATDTLFIKQLGGSFKEYVAQQGEEADPDNLIESLSIENRGASPVTFTLWFGFGDFVDRRKEVTVSGNVTIDNTPLPVTGPLTDTELRAAAVPISTLAQKAEDSVAASGDIGLVGLKVRRDDVSEQTSAAGDYTIPVADRFGASVARDQNTLKRTYRAAFQIAPAATPTDVFQIIGAANRIVEITKVVIGGVKTTAGQMLASLIKRSAANTGGTATNPTAVPLNSGDAAAAAVISNYSANPAGLGAAVGSIVSRRFPIGQATSLIAPSEIDFEKRGKPVTLLSAAEALCLNLDGTTLTGGTLDVEIEWKEITV